MMGAKCTIRVPILIHARSGFPTGAQKNSKMHKNRTITHQDAY